jgi:signal transduction histidine kinase/CheY-like chemotaxis protein
VFFRGHSSSYTHNPIHGIKFHFILFPLPNFCNFIFFDCLMHLQLTSVEHGRLFHACGLLSMFAMFPLLFHNDRSDDFEDSTLETVIDKDVFKIFVSSSFAAAIPLTLDLIIDIFTKRSKQLLPRAVICGTILFTSCLHVYFSLWQQRAYAAWVIYDMQIVMLGAITLHQVQIRNKHVITTHAYAYFALFCWNVGTIIKAYGGDSTTTSLIGRFMRYASIFLTFCGMCKHLYMVAKGQLNDWYNKWQQIAFESLIVVVLTISIGSSNLLQERDDFDVSGTSFIIISFDMLAYLVIMSTIITNEYRYDCSQAQQKLGVKRMFVRYFSHEVRTPLSSCMLGIEYMKAAIRNPTEACIEEITGILDEVSDGCNTAIDFMNNLLLYEKVDSMEMPLYLKREDLSAVCAQVLKTFQMSARQLEVNLSLDVHESLKTTSAGAAVPAGDAHSPSMQRMRAIAEIDGPKVVIVLRNLMSNALKFTPKGGRVSLSVIPIDKSMSAFSGIGSLGGSFRGSFREQLVGNFVNNSRSGHDASSISGGGGSVVNLPPSLPADTTHFRVILSDTGRGMSQEEQKQLFTKIVQFSPNENQKGGGSGIGLFLSHKIMADHNLKIQVHSEGTNGSGTQFFIDFPRKFSPMKKNLSKGDSDAKADLLDVSEGDVEMNNGGNYSDTSSEVAELNEDPLAMRNTLPPLVGQSSISQMMLMRNMPCDDKNIDELNILIVDDSVMNRKMLTRTLKQHHVGASHEGAGDGLELLSLMGVPGATDAGYEAVVTDLDSNDAKVTPVFTLRGKTDFDVIILDDNMTYMNGSEAVKILRQHGYEGLVVGLTGSALDEDLNAFCAAGVDYALSKPFVIEDFIDLLK